jgi:hypothetical protein
MKKTVTKAASKAVTSAVAEAVLSSSQSFSGTQEKVQQALQNILNGRAADVDPCDGTCCTGCGYECPGNCCSNCVGKNSVYCWIRDIFSDKVVYSMNGDLYQRDYKVDAAGNVTLGDPIEVEVAYQTLGESHRLMAAFGCDLKEAGATYNKKTGELTLTIIKPGLNKSKSRVYPASVLKRDMSIFENAKMFTNHATSKEDSARPEGDVNQWVAQLGKPWAEADGRIRAKAKVIDPPFKEKLATLQEAGLLNEMGVSIRAIGVGSEAEVPDGESSVKANLVERLVACRSVDFVTFAGAGGQCEVLESDRSDEFDFELMTLEQLKERRQDLVDLIESNAREVVLVNKTLEQQLQEANAALAAANAKNADLETKVTESEAATKKATAAAKLKELLEASKLPEKAKERLTAQFKEAVTVDGMEAAIQSEKDYIASLGTSTAPKTKVTNLGKETNESDGGDKDKKPNLVESFMGLGLTEAQAKVAAAGR